MAHILIVEDEYAISELMKRNLNLTGHTCEQAFDGRTAQELYHKNSYDLILLDIMLPGISGFELMEEFTEAPVIFITAKDNPSDKLRGLTSGAEDYITKPFDILELLARVNIVLRRNKRGTDVFVMDGVRVDFGEHTIIRDDHVIEMTPQEFSLLEILIRNRNLTMSREQLWSRHGDTTMKEIPVQSMSIFRSFARNLVGRNVFAQYIRWDIDWRCPNEVLAETLSGGAGIIFDGLCVLHAGTGTVPL